MEKILKIGKTSDTFQHSTTPILQHSLHPIRFGRLSPPLIRQGVTKMTDALKKNYFMLLIPLILGFGLACWARACDWVAISSAEWIRIAGPLIFFLCMVLAIGFPIFYRSLFAHKSRDLIRVSEKKLIQFERTLITVTMITPYLALTAVFLELPRFYTAGALLMGLYAVYYFYPSKRRIAFDRRIFRAL